MENQDYLMRKLMVFLDIFKDLTGNFNITDFKTILDLTCGCRKPVYVIMIEHGFHVKYATSTICHEHDCEHQFSYDWTVKNLCMDFFDFNLENPNSPYHFTLQPRK